MWCVLQAAEAAASGSSHNQQTVEQLHEARLRLQEQLGIKVQEVEHLRATVHKECMERTYLLDKFNQMRAEAALPPLDMAAVAEQAARYVPSSVLAMKHAAGRGESPAKGEGRTRLPSLPHRPASGSSTDSHRRPPSDRRPAKLNSAGSGRSDGAGGGAHDDDGGEIGSVNDAYQRQQHMWNARGRGRGAQGSRRGRARGGTFR